MKKALYFIIGLALLSSCEKEIEFKGEQTDSRLVINSIVDPGRPVEAHISKSYFFLDINEDTQAPNDLVAMLYVNGNRIGEMTPGFDTIWEMYWPYDYELLPVYYNDYCPQEGDIVAITASAHGFEDVEGTTSALPKYVDCQMDVEVTTWRGWYQHNYNFDTQEYEEDSIWEVAGNLELTFTITDPNPGKTDCFRLFTSRNSSMTIGENRRSIHFDYDDPTNQ